MQAMSHPYKLFAALLIAGVLLLPAGFLSDSGRAFVLDPQIAVDPDIGRPGSGVQVSGIGFPPFSSVIIGFSENGMKQVVGFTSTGADGSFTATVAVPADAAPGQAIFFAENSGGRAEADFFVEGSEPIGDGGGKKPSETCTVTLTLLKMTVFDRVPLEDEWRIRTTSKLGHKVTEVLEAKRGETTEVNLVVASKTLKKKSFPFKENLRVHVDHGFDLSDPRERMFQIFGKKGFDLNCPPLPTDSPEVGVLVEGTAVEPFLGGTNKHPISVGVTYRYEVTEP